MSVWFSEKEFRTSGVLSLGVHLNPDSDAPAADGKVTLNVPFMSEIKQDFDFRETLDAVSTRLHATPPIAPQEAAKELAHLRDQLEAYFAMEEFYGYFQHAATTNPRVNTAAERLQGDHEALFLELNALVDLAEQIVYRECSKTVSVADLAEKLTTFSQAMTAHEHKEMELMMQLHNEDIGVGD